jgi:hypothetical protein
MRKRTQQTREGVPVHASLTNEGMGCVSMSCDGRWASHCFVNQMQWIESKFSIVDASIIQEKL